MAKVLRRYGWRPDLPARGDLYLLAPLSDVAQLPPAVDLRPKMPPVVDQGQIGSCTANGIAAAYGFLEIQQLAAKSGPEQFGDGVFDPVSRLFIYWNERSMEGDTGQDAGAQIRDGIATLKKWGACREATWPYDPSLLFQTPSRAAYSEAVGHKDLHGYRIANTVLENLLSCLASGFPFVFGVTLYGSFESDAVASSGLVPMPGASEAPIGGHCMTAVGYDEPSAQFLVRNSWGESWGLGGHCWMPFAYLTSDQLASDFWTLRA